MDRIKSIRFIHLLMHRLIDLKNRFINSDIRKKRLFLTFFISTVIIISVFVVLFTCFSIFQSQDESPFEGFDEFNQECLKSHNKYRSLHGVPPLQLDDELISFAKERAKYLVLTDVFEHPADLEKYGENLHYIMPKESYSCDKVVTPWYNEIRDYNYHNPRASRGMIGHFTQVVWKNTEKVGCAQAYSRVSTKCYTVCNYYRPGNYINRYPENVLHRLPHPK